MSATSSPDRSTAYRAGPHRCAYCVSMVPAERGASLVCSEACSRAYIAELERSGADPYALPLPEEGE